jgi:hypothetical protein
MSVIDQVTKMLSLTDGRDKSYKFLQGATKALAFYTKDTASADKLNKISKSLGEGRSIMRLGKWTSNIQKINSLVAKADAQGGWNRLLVIEVVRVLGDMGYVIGDNLTYLSKYKVFALDPAACTKHGKVAQFWGFFCQVIMDVLTVLMLDPRKPNYAEARETAILNLTKDVADTIVVLATVAYLPKSIFNPSGGLQGILLTLSGAIATYQNWNKAAPTAAK